MTSHTAPSYRPSMSWPPPRPPPKQFLEPSDPAGGGGAIDDSICIRPGTSRKNHTSYLHFDAHRIIPIESRQRSAMNRRGLIKGVIIIMDNKIDFLRGSELDAAAVRKLLIDQRDGLVKRKQNMQEKHDMIRFQANRGMSRARMITTWGRDMVTEALDSDGIQTSLVAAG